MLYPPAVEEENGLLPSCKALFQALLQAPAEHAAVAVLQFLTHINQLNLRQLLACGPLGQGDKLKIASLSLVEALRGWELRSPRTTWAPANSARLMAHSLA